MNGYPRWFLPFLIVVAMIVFISGLALTPNFADRVWAIEMGWRASGGVRILSTAFHVLTGFIIIGCLGALLPIHIRSGWYRRINHLSGIMCATALIVLGIGGIGVLYLGDESLISINSTTHVLLGLLFSVVASTHIVKGFRIKAANK